MCKGGSVDCGSGVDDNEWRYSVISVLIVIVNRNFCSAKERVSGSFWELSLIVDGFNKDGVMLVTSRFETLIVMRTHFYDNGVFTWEMVSEWGFIADTVEDLEAGILFKVGGYVNFCVATILK